MRARAGPEGTETPWGEVLSHRRALEKGCRAVGCAGADFDDACLESLLRAFQRVSEPAARETVRTPRWFWTVGYRVGLNLRRGQARRRERELHAGREAARGLPDPAAVAQQREDQLLARRAWHALPLAERRAIEVVVLEGPSALIPGGNYPDTGGAGWVETLSMTSRK